MNTSIITNELTIVEYNRSAKQWEAQNGTVTSFPPGTAGKRQAQLVALRNDVPQVAAEIEAIIANAEAVYLMYDAEAISSRAIRAGFLVRDGHVLPPVPFDEYGGCLNEIARVQGSEPEPYIISYVDDQVICECHDFMLGNAPFLPSGQSACKHVLAVLITEALQEDTETA